MKPLDEDSAEAERTIMDLRSASLTFEQIANNLGLSNRGQAFKIYQRALERIPAEGVVELRTLEGQRLDALQAAIWDTCMAGGIKSINASLRIMERRARLFGLDAPVKVLAKIKSHFDGSQSVEDMTPEEMIARLKELRVQIAEMVGEDAVPG
jgi:hypothetical protein